MKPKSDRLPKYWTDDQGRLAVLVGMKNGKVTFRRRGFKTVVSSLALYRTWKPDSGKPIPRNALPSICNRPSP